MLSPPCHPCWGLTSDLEEGHLEVPAESLYEDSLGGTDSVTPLLWCPGQRPLSATLPTHLQGLGQREAQGSRWVSRSL